VLHLGLTLADKAVTALRELPAAEWGRLHGTELGAMVERLRPDQTRIAVVEADGRIVGCWSITAILHAEGIWIDPTYRDGSVLRKLLRWMTQTARDLGARSVLTGASDPGIEDLIRRFGGHPIPPRFALPLKARLEE
jgi:hypothetical protein